MNSAQNIFNYLGDPVTAAQPENGFYKVGDHFYHVHERVIAHVNVGSKLINTIDCIYLAEYETLEPVSREIFEAELRSTIFDIGIYEYVKSI